MTIGKNAIEATTRIFEPAARADPDQDQRRDGDLRHALQPDEDRHDQPLEQRKADHQRRNEQREQRRRNVAAENAADGRDAVHLDQRPFVDHQPGDVGRRRQQEVRHLERARQNLPEDDKHDDQKYGPGALRHAAPVAWRRSVPSGIFSMRERQRHCPGEPLF